MAALCAFNNKIKAAIKMPPLVIVLFFPSIRNAIAAVLKENTLVARPGSIAMPKIADQNVPINCSS